MLWPQRVCASDIAATSSYLHTMCLGPGSGCRVRNSLFRLLAGLVVLGACSEAPVPSPREKGFEDVSAALGLAQQFGNEAGEYGALWADLNGDEWLDLAFMNHGIPSLYINQSGEQFVDEIRESGVKTGQWTYPQQDDRHGGSCADYDNDGDVDLFIAHGAMRGETAGIKQDELLNNDGLANFRDVTLEAGVSNAEGRARLGTWADYDNDGWLDLYVGNYESQNVLYKNNGDGTFSEVTREMGAEVTGPAPAWADYDGDGDADVLVAWTLKLLQNPGSGPFQKFTWRAGLGKLPSRLYPYSLAWGDADNDGDLDLAFASPNSNNAVYVNEGGRFVSAAVLILEKDEITAGVAWGDADNDGDLDLFVASSHRLRLYLNMSGAKFAAPIVLFEQSATLEAGGEIALGDYDKDGFLDVAFSTIERHVLLRNTRSLNSWIQIRLQGTASNRQAFGAKVWVEPQNASGAADVQFREYWGDSGVFQSVGCGPLHFGLGTAARINVRVLWPSGRETVIADVSANQFLDLTEPAD